MTFRPFDQHSRFIPALASSILLAGSCAFAQSVASVAPFDLHAATAGSSANVLFLGASSSESSSVADAATGSDPVAAATGAGIPRPGIPLVAPAFQPFSAVAVSVKLGTTGVGVDVATPLARRLGLRSGASFFSYNTSLTTDGLNITGGLHLQGASTSLDIYPFKNSFRISPGLTYTNKNRMNANLSVPGGQSFSLGDGGNYTSDPSNPIQGTASFVFGNSLAPRLTMGFESLRPNHGGRVSFPLDIGVQYTAAPVVKLAISGNSCGSQSQSDGSMDSGCGAVDQTNVAQEQSELQQDLKPLRFYPLVSFGVTVKFGHVGRSE